MSKKVLVLGYNDFPAEGHAYSLYLALKALGQEAYFLSLVSECLPDAPAYFLDFHKRFSPSCLWYRLNRKIRSVFSSKKKGTNEFCFLNPGNYYVGDAKKILNRIPVVPDVIMLGWIDYFISPKVVWDLYNETHAKIVIPMLDHHLITGGCHYPCDCRQFETGCHNCPALKNRKKASALYKEKQRCLRDVPFTLVGTSYDLQKAKRVPFLQGKEMLRTIGTPIIPFVKSKNDAREEFDICPDDFVILCGASSVEEKRKGFKYLLDAISVFSDGIVPERGVTLILLGGGVVDTTNISSRVKVKCLGFLKLDQLYTAYYAADVFVSPSVDDSGPYMVNYSIACGTPVVSFPIGIALDLVQSGLTGYMAKYLDSGDMAKGLSFFYHLSSIELQKISDNCKSLMDNLRENNSPWYQKVLE